MKHLFKFYFVTMLALLTSTNMFAFDCEVDGIYYNRLSSDEFEVTYGDNKYTGNIVIPETVTYRDKVFKIVQISSRAFAGCTSLTSVSIPQSVTSFSQFCFDGCSNLSSITIPQNVTKLGEGSFKGCSKLSFISLPQGITTIESETFYGCSSLNSIILPEGITSIQSRAFQNCSSLSSIDLPNSLTEIKTYAFYACNSLTSISLPQGLKSILRYAFAGCSSLTSIIIPNQVSEIYEHTFDGCTSLASVVLPEGLQTINNSLFLNCSSLTEISIPNSLHTICENAFDGCTGLKKVIVKDINAWCNISFRTLECNPLHYAHHLYSDEETEIKELVLAFSRSGSSYFPCIRKYAFYDAEGLEKIYILCGDASVPYIQDNAFGNTCYTWTDLYVVGGGKTNYQNNNNWKKFKSISEYHIIFDNIEYRPTYFTDSFGLRVVGNKDCSGNIVIPESVTFKEQEFDVLGIGGFQNCTNLTSIHLPNSLRFISGYAFQSCTGLSSIDIPNSVSQIGWYAFQDCYSLTSVKLPDNLSEMGLNAFYNCYSLTSIAIPNSITTINQYTFHGCM
ncbi:leucine-rich repeat domain-containing protein [uncultured Prevotella sp.]|uniref:leucine-rich repeat domain-containing protein n=1 Tax=uncultured Prevotella sp. TaxID=159272 RepID=UPI0025845AEB|nr:leucine-rich repeat domain-containing protein [uncultured Prevotella sp.]